MVMLIGGGRINRWSIFPGAESGEIWLFFQQAVCLHFFAQEIRIAELIKAKKRATA